MFYGYPGKFGGWREKSRPYSKLARRMRVLELYEQVEPGGTFPAPPPAPVRPEPEPETRAIAHARPGHVLIVDDEPVNSSEKRV